MYRLAPILLALVLGGVVMTVSGYSPITSYRTMLVGSLSLDRLPEVLLLATPLIFTGLSVTFAYRCGLFNIGAEGQLLMGAFASAWVGFSLTSVPAFIHLPLALSAGALAGALIGWIAGVLKARLGAHEVITTIMLNYVCSLFTYYLVLHPFAAARALPQTKPIAATAQLPQLFPDRLVSCALFVAILIAIITSLLLWRTVLGYEIRAVGANPTAAAYKGIDVRRSMILAMAISGAIAGLGGAGETLGTYRRFIQGFSPGYGFDGIAVALMGATNPLGVVPAALLFGALRAGGTYMGQFAGIPSEFVGIIQGLVILFVVAPEMVKQLMSFRLRKTTISEVDAARETAVMTTDNSSALDDTGEEHEYL